MNETLNTIFTRFACRKYDGTALTDQQVQTLAKAAVAAPSSMNQQAWSVFAITDKTFLDSLDKKAVAYLKEHDTTLHQRLMDRGGTLFYNAPCMILIMQKQGTDLDTGIATENVALAASSMGLGNVICGLTRILFRPEIEGNLRQSLQIGEEWEFGCSILVGNTDQKGTPHEPDMEKVSFITRV